MDAHDELFYRLNDPDPHTQAMAELDLLHKIFGGDFVERWLAWNGFECEPRSCLRRLARSEARTARCSLSRLRASETAERSLWYPPCPMDVSSVHANLRPCTGRELPASHRL